MSSLFNILTHSSNDEFINAVNEFNLHESISYKVEIAFKYESPKSLFNPIKRTIDSKEYLFGLEVENNFSADNIANAVINKIKHQVLSHKKDEILNRISRWDFIQKEEKKGILEGELELIENKINMKNNIYLYGYNCEKRKVNFQPFSDSILFLQIRTFDIYGGLLYVASGAVDFLLKISLNKWLNELSEGKLLTGSKEMIEQELGITRKPKGRGGSNSKFTDAQNKYNGEELIPDSDQEIIYQINKSIKCLNGTISNKTKIMNDEDYRLLVSYIIELIKTKKCPIIKKQFGKLPAPITTDFIRYTFSKLYDDVIGTATKDKTWIEFLHNTFKQFPQTDKGMETTFQKFRSYPSKNYSLDLERISGY